MREKRLGAGNTVWQSGDDSTAVRAKKNRPRGKIVKKWILDWNLIFINFIIVLPICTISSSSTLKRRARWYHLFPHWKREQRRQNNTQTWYCRTRRIVVILDFVLRCEDEIQSIKYILWRPQITFNRFPFLSSLISRKRLNKNQEPQKPSRSEAQKSDGATEQIHVSEGERKKCFSLA